MLSVICLVFESVVSRFASAALPPRDPLTTGFPSALPNLTVPVSASLTVASGLSMIRLSLPPLVRIWAVVATVPFGVVRDTRLRLHSNIWNPYTVPGAFSISLSTNVESSVQLIR